MKKQILSLSTAALLAFSVSAFSVDKVSMVNVNTATEEQLDEGLIGVGKKTASEIVSHRDKNGPFKNMDDLDQVKYIGSAFLKKNESRIIFEE
jgi:competence protein ComEA